MPRIVARFIRLGPERPQTRFGLTLAQKNESLVTVSDLGENGHTLFIFHEDFRMQKVVARFIRLGSERPHTRFQDRKSTRLNSSHSGESRMPSSA